MSCVALNLPLAPRGPGLQPGASNCVSGYCATVFVTACSIAVHHSSQCRDLLRCFNSRCGNRGAHKDGEHHISPTRVLTTVPIKTNLTDLRPSRGRYTRQIKLLSGGQINGDNFPDGMITVFPWDNSVDEWIASRVRKGANKGRNVLFQVLPKICDLNGLPLSKFVSSEVMAVLMVSRSILRNDAISFTWECEECGTSGEQTVKIPGDLQRVGEKNDTWPGYDAITLPDSKDVAKMRPITVGEELAVTDRSEPERKATCSDTVARILAGLVAVNDGKPDSAKEALTWFNALSPADQDYLITEYDKTQPQLGTTIQMKCDSCEHEFNHTLRLDTDFFRAAGVSGNRRAVENPVRPGVQEQGSNAGPNTPAGVANTANAGVARKAS